MVDGVVQKITSALRTCDFRSRGYSLKSGESAENLTWRHVDAIEEEVEEELEADSTKLRIN